MSSQCQNNDTHTHTHAHTHARTHSHTHTHTHSGPETQVLNYQTQQYKILPLIATAYAVVLTGQYMMKMFLQTQSKIAEGNFESLPEVC